MAYANHDLQMPLTHESCCRPGGGRVSIPAQECKAGLSLGRADQESRTGPEIEICRLDKDGYHRDERIAQRMSKCLDIG